MGIRGARDSEKEDNVIEKEDIQNMDVEQLEKLDIKGADSENIDAIKQVMKSSGKDGFSKEDIRKLVLQVNENVNIIDNASANISQGIKITPVVFEKAGIIGVDDENMKFVLQKLNDLKSLFEPGIMGIAESITTNLSKEKTHILTAKEIQQVVNEVKETLKLLKEKINFVKDSYELPHDTENTDLAKINAVKSEIISALNGQGTANNIDVMVTKEGSKYVVTLSVDGVQVTKNNVQITIKKPSLENATFQGELSKTDYELSESIVISGKLLSGDENSVAIVGHDIAVTVFSADGQSLITLDQVQTDANGNFQYSFKVSKYVEVGAYKVVISAKGISNGTKTLLFNLVEPKEEVKVEFNYTECTVKISDNKFTPDLIATTTGLKEEDIVSVKITCEDSTMISITQRPVWPEGGFPKSKTRAFGKALKTGTTRIVATVTDKSGKIYTAYCNVTITN